MLEYILIGVAIATTLLAFAGIVAVIDWAARKLDR
jgi:hypothetical protein